jgi:hypothetical protein
MATMMHGANVYLDSEIYDDDSPGHHQMDDYDEMMGGDHQEDDFPVSCFSREYLTQLAGTEDLEACAFLEMRADTSQEDLSGVGLAMPMLVQLRLSNSIVPSARTFGSTFQRLQVVWIARSGLEDLKGIASLVDLKELYAAFNEVSDVSPLAELDNLQVVDLEANQARGWHFFVLGWHFLHHYFCSQTPAPVDDRQPVCSRNQSDTPGSDTPLVGRMVKTRFN